MRIAIISFLIVITFHQAYCQWVQSETLVGGSIVWDMIEYKGDLYIFVNEHGVFRSTDQGASWSPVMTTYDYSGQGLFTIHNDQLIVGYFNVLLKTTDGVNWTSEDTPSTFVRDVASDGSTIAIATLKGVFITKDEGKTWINVNDGETTQDLESVAVDGETLWIGGQNGSLFKSSNSGASWDSVVINTPSISPILQIINQDSTLYLNMGYGGVVKSTDQGQHWESITTHENAISYVSTFYYTDSVLYLSDGSYLYASTNGGASWIKQGGLLPSISLSTMWFTQNNVFIGTWGGGVFRNNRQVSAEWVAGNKGLRLTETHGIIVKDDRLIVATEYLHVRYSDDEGGTWHPTGLRTYGDARAIASTPNYLFAGGGGSGIHRFDEKKAYWQRVDNGLSSGLINSLAANQDYVFTGTDDGLFRSGDLGDQWVNKSEGITSGIRSVITFESYVLVGTWDGLFISEDNGDSWSRISSGLPDESITCVLLVDSVLFAATRFNGLHKSTDMGASWENVSDSYVFSLAERHGYIFLGSWNGTILASPDLGETWTSISDQLPDAIISAINFTDHYIVTGTLQPGHGIWKRPLYEIVPPTISFRSVSSDTSFIIGQPIHVIFDQVIKNTKGGFLDAVALQQLIAVENNHGQVVSFSAQIDESNQIITLLLDQAEEASYYTITVDSVSNLSGISTSITRSMPLRAIHNNSPTINSVFLSGRIDTPLSFRSADFIQSFTDADGDTLVKVMIKSLPEHGVLKYNNEPVTLEDEISSGEINNLVYVPDQDFSGSDELSWNAFDGKEYAQNDAKLVFDIASITGITTRTGQDQSISLQPNPATDELSVVLTNDDRGTYHLRLLHVSGKEVLYHTLTKHSPTQSVTLSISDIPSRVYIMDIRSSNIYIRRKFIKR